MRKWYFQGKYYSEAIWKDLTEMYKREIIDKNQPLAPWFGSWGIEGTDLRNFYHTAFPTYWCEYVICDKEITQKTAGNLRKYCCESHKQLAYRDRLLLGEQRKPQLTICALPSCKQGFIDKGRGRKQIYCCHAHRTQDYRRIDRELNSNSTLNRQELYKKRMALVEKRNPSSAVLHDISITDDEIFTAPISLEGDSE